VTADIERIAAIAARAAAEAVVHANEEQRRRANERIVGIVAIAAALEVSDRTVWNWVQRHGLPLDRGPGEQISITRWNLERWIDARRTAIELEKK
jgi:hypothetical protein